MARVSQDVEELGREQCREEGDATAERPALITQGLVCTYKMGVEYTGLTSWAGSKIK